MRSPTHSRRRDQVYCTVGVVVWVASILTGCADHRMELAEFLEINRAAAAEQQAEAQAQQDLDVDMDRHLSPYKVGPGDVISVTLTGAEGVTHLTSVPTRVDRDGNIDLPVVGALPVAGKELEDIETVIQAAYVPAVYRDASCFVALSAPDATNVLVVGSVSVPGLVQLRRTERNMLYAIVAAGGTSQFASGSATLRRIRRPAEEVTLNLLDPVELRAVLTLDPLQDGDIITVHTATPNTVFVGGLVNRPGPQPYPPGTETTVLQTIAAANGLRTDVTPKFATLVRRQPNGTDLRVKLDLNRIAMGSDPNITLAGGDILWVPATFGTKVQDFINRNVFFRAGVSVNYNVSGIEYLNRASQQSRGLGGSNLQNAFDPFGFLNQNALLQGINTATSP